MVLVVPALILVGLLILYPICQAVYYSFTNWDGLSTNWVGPSAWSQAFHNPTMWQALKNLSLIHI